VKAGPGGALVPAGRGEPAGSGALGLRVAVAACLGFLLLLFPVVSEEALASEATGESAAPSISASGRYQSFESTASNMVDNDTNAKKDIFVRDAQDKTTERVSVSAAGAQANGDSYDASMSDDGRYVAFTSDASNLVSEDTNGAPDVFLYDGTARTIERVSVSGSAGQLSFGGNDPAISGDGGYVAFVTKSEATSGGYCSQQGGNGEGEDVYLYDRTAKLAVDQISGYLFPDYAGVCGEPNFVQGDGRSLSPSVSRDGRYVAFESDSTNLTSDTNGARDIFIRDRGPEQYGVDRVSIADTDAQADGASTSPSISDDGRYVAFASVASNLDQSAPCCAVRDTNATSDIHVRDRSGRSTIWASRRPATDTAGGSYLPSMSGDGTRVSFASDAALRTSGANSDTNGVRDVYQTALARADRAPLPLSFDDDQGLGNRASDEPAESGDGKCTAFSSAATSFLPSFMADGNGVADVYRHCWKPRGTQPFSVCSVDRISEPPDDGKDLPRSYGYDAEGIEPGKVNLCAGHPVKCATGNFFEAQGDFAIAGRGVGLDLTRTYNAQDAASAAAAGPLGYGWSFSFGERLEIDSGSGGVSVHHADGQVARFSRRADGSYAAERLIQSSLEKKGDGSYTYTLPDQRTFAFNAAGRLTAKADRNSNQTKLAYDGSGRLGSVTDPAGRKLSLDYNPDGTVKQASDPAGQTVRYGYDGDKNLTDVTDVAGRSWQFTYDAKHRMTTLTNPRGAKTTNVYDARDRVTGQTDPVGRETKWSYGGDETKVTDPAGNVTDTRFRSHLPVWIAGAQGASEEAITHLAYDADANLAKVTDPNGHAWSYGYDGQGNRTKATDPLGHSTAYAYDAKRNLTTLTLPSGSATSYDYDSHSNPVSTKQTLTESGQTPTTTFAYDEVGQLTSVTDPLGASWRYGYNDQGDQTSATSPAGRKTSAGYNAQSWLMSSVSGRGNASGSDPAAYTTSYTRDAYGRPTAIRDPLGHSTALAYDGVGNMTDATDRDGRHSQFGFDLADQATEVTRGDGSVLKTGYDANGQVKSQTDGLGRTTDYGRDPLGRVTSTSDPLGRRTTYAYDRGGNRTALTDPAGRVTNWGYDSADRLESIYYSSGAPARIGYGYDVDGQLTSMTDGSGRSGFGYDSLGRLTASSNGRGQTLRYGYDAADRLTSLAYPSALTPLNRQTGVGLDPVATGTVTRGYDADGYMTSVADWLGHTTSFGYDADGELVRTARPDTSATIYTRDPNGLVTNLADSGLQAALVASTPRTDEGLVASRSELGAAASPGERFGYDGAARLAGAGADGTSGYGYDAADNPTKLPSGGGSLTQSFDAANQLTTATKAGDGSPQKTLTYDSDGNRNSSTAQDGARTSYGYDQADQLTSYSGPDRSRPGQSASAQYTYDATGLRQARTVDGVERTQTYDRSQTLAVPIADGPTAYIAGPDGSPVEQVLQDGSVRYFHQDAQGSTRALTNPLGGVVASYAFDPYGNPTGPATGVENPFGYNGQYTDPESGLQYLAARYYDPATAQFLTRDPIAGETRAPYDYANDSPTNYSDPTGLLSLSDVGGALGDGAKALGEAGVGALDSPTFGLTSKSLGAVGVHVNTCSGFYKAGGYIPIGGPLGVLGKGAKLAKLARAASAGRRFAAPSTKDRELGGIYEQLFRTRDRFPGGTADAVRRVGDEGHIVKAQQRIRQIDKLLSRRGDLDRAERNTATRVRNDLADALKGRGR